MTMPEDMGAGNPHHCHPEPSRALCGWGYAVLASRMVLREGICFSEYDCANAKTPRMMKQLQRDEMAGGVMRTITLVVAITLSSVGALAQGHGNAPFFFVPHDNPNDDQDTNAAAHVSFFADNLYPPEYPGDVWTGTVTAIHEREISLVWTDKKGKIEAFTGRVLPSYDVPLVNTVNGHHEFATRKVSVDPPAQDLVGKKLMVYYWTATKKVKVGGKNIKVSTNYIFRLVPQEGKQ